MSKTAIVMPCLNQGRFIGNVIREYINYFNKDIDIVVVDNGSTDNTVEITRRLMADHSNIHLLCFETALGKGAAIRKGFEYALKNQLSSLLGFVDPDGAIAPAEFSKLINTINPEIDFAIGSRWCPGAKIVRKQPLSRILGGRTYNLLVRMLFGIPFHDTQCGAKIIKTQSYRKIRNDLQVNGFTFDLEMITIAIKHNIQIREVPIEWNDQEGSTFSISKSSGSVALDTAKTWIRTRLSRI